MNICIGILAHNEAHQIESTLASLFSQTLLTTPHPEVSRLSVVVVPNGCTDQTAAVSDAFFESCQGMPLVRDGIVQTRVASLAQGGKARAWNVFVHDLSDPDADFLVLMDADIQFCQPDVLAQMLQSLLEQPEKVVNTAHPIKSTALKPNLTLIERISLAATHLSKPKGPSICGQLYMARTQALRGVAIPLGLVGQDGFIGGMLSSAQLTAPEDIQRYMVRLEQPSHYFEPYLKLSSLLRHETQIVKATLFHQALYRHLRQFQESIATYVLRMNDTQPDWVAQQIAPALPCQKILGIRWFIPNWMVTRRLSAWRQKPWLKRLVLIPITLMATAVDWWVMVQSNRELNRGAYQQYWR